MLHFTYRNVKADVMNNFSHVVELLDLTTEGMITLLAMKILGMDKIGSEPTNDVPTVEELAKTVVDLVWHEPGEAMVPIVLASTPEHDDNVPAHQFCICGDGMSCILQCFCVLTRNACAAIQMV